MQIYKKKYQFKNKTAVVVGSDGLIGKEIVKNLLELKCNVIRIEKKKVNNKKNYFYLNSKDDSKQIDQFNSIVRKIKKIDIFINASYPKTKNWNKINFKSKNFKLFKENMNLHLNTFVWFSKIIAEKMKKNKVKGVILNFSSIYGSVSQDISIYKNTNISYNVAYSAIKGGISSFTRLLAAYYGKYGIRANCISPGGILDKKKMNKKFIKNYSKRVPVGRMANVKEISAPSIFLVSEESSYINGHNLFVDGGWTCI